MVYPGFDELDALGPYEVLRMADDAVGPGSIETQLAACNGAVEITASHGTVALPRFSLQDGGWDMVIVPGGGWARRKGAYVQAKRGELPRTLAALHREGVILASVCTGAMILAAAGVTRGRPAITHPAAIEALRESGADIVQARVVDDGNVVTAGGITSGIDLGLWLVERLGGRPLADQVEERLQYTRTGGVHLGPHSRTERVGVGAGGPP